LKGKFTGNLYIYIYIWWEKTMVSYMDSCRFSLHSTKNATFALPEANPLATATVVACGRSRIPFFGSSAGSSLGALGTGLRSGATSSRTWGSGSSQCYNPGITSGLTLLSPFVT
jgi:hypothetical protein